MAEQYLQILFLLIDMHGEDVFTGKKRKCRDPGPLMRVRINDTQLRPIKLEQTLGTAGNTVIETEGAVDTRDYTETRVT